MKHFDNSEVREIGLVDANYPYLLRVIKKPPTSLRVRGSQPLKRNIIAISGSRKTTPQALQTADKIGKMLAEHGYTVVTGLDAAAVTGALSKGGNVIGVVPYGLKALPTHTLKLAQDIFATGGAIVSEYHDNFTEVLAKHYLRRNEIITGIAEITIIAARGRGRMPPRTARLSKDARLSLHRT